MKSWALYLVKFIDAYKALGVDLWGLTVQNEPLATTCLWQSMFYTAEQQADFVANYLGPALRAAHPEVKLMIHDDQTISLLEFAGEILKNDAAARYIDGVAYHWYMTMEGAFENGPARTPVPIVVPNLVGGGAYVNQIWQTLKEQGQDKFMLMSEACNGYLLGPKWVGPRPGDWGYGYAYSHDILWQMRNGASGWTDWNLWLDARGGPNLAGNFVDSPVLLQGPQGFYQNPSFFHLAHFSKYVLPGSRRVDLGITCGARKADYCQAVAFMTPEGNAVIVMTNDEITVGPLAAGESTFCIGGMCIPNLGEFIVPSLAKGHGSFTTSSKTSISWTIRCGGQSISGTLPWKGIQTVVMPCNTFRKS
jgi:glucosylceramidase